MNQHPIEAYADALAQIDRLSRALENQHTEHRQTLRLLGAVTVARDKAETERNEALNCAARSANERHLEELARNKTEAERDALKEQIDEARKCLEMDESFGALVVALWSKPEAELVADRNAAIARVAALESAQVDFCDECKSPLSACGDLRDDGTPTMDCRVCRLLSILQVTRSERDATLAQAESLEAELAKAQPDLLRLARIDSGVAQILAEPNKPIPFTPEPEDLPEGHGYH